MKRRIGLIACTILLFLTACGSGGDDANNGLNSFNPNNENNGTVEIRERDGIPSDDFADLLHYYISTQEDGPGLYAYRPATPDEAPVYIDANFTMQSPFAQTFPITQGDAGSLKLRPTGVFYNAGDGFPPMTPEPGELPSVRSYLVTTDPSQLDAAPQQVSNYDIPGSFAGIGAYLAYGDSLSTSSIALNVWDIRLDLGMTADDEPVVLPEDGRLLASSVGEGTRLHEHWLYIDEDGTLNFYDRAFENKTPVVDEDSGMPIEDLEVTGTFVSYLGLGNLLVLLGEAGSEGVGRLYRVSRPTASGGGVARLLTNDAGESIELSLPGAVLGRTVPGDASRWTGDDVFYFAEGPSLFDSAAPSRITRVTADGWSALEVQSDDPLGGFNPGLFVRVDGGFFWAPGFEPELVYPDEGDPASWERTPLPNAPRIEESRIFSSAGDWVYYVSSDDEAVAFNVKTNDVVALADSTWVGASLDSSIDEGSLARNVVRQEIETVLVHLSGNRLGAVEGANPQDGVVILGDLPETTEEVLVNGPALGPARLIRIEHEDGSVEVAAIDTRESGSLRRIMESPAVEWAYEVGTGATAFEMTIRPDATSPLTLF